MIAWQERVTIGTISIGGKVVNHLEPKDRGIAMVFQSYALYPHFNLFRNMAYALEVVKKPKDEIKTVVDKTAKALQLDHMMDRKPQALSGGQRQRVALGRAIVRDPSVFLFDEPLSNLDAKMRVQMRSEITRLHGELDTTMIYVTHDQIEAMTMGDRICVMRDGMIMQVADPLNLYLCPDNLFVAGFIGSPPMNLLKGKIRRRDGPLYFIEDGERDVLALPLEGSLHQLASRDIDREIVFGIRPENITNRPKAGAGASIPMRVEVAEPLGGESLISLRSGTGNLVARIRGEHLFLSNERVTIQINMEKVTLFDPNTEEAIRRAN